jgi:hypothetical protein
MALPIAKTGVPECVRTSSRLGSRDSSVGEKAGHTKETATCSKAKAKQSPVITIYLEHRRQHEELNV